jgi:DNA-binding XRE family transcriptional regulator
MGREFRKLREVTGISQEELAKRIGKSRFTINKYESGRSIPSVQVLVKICELLGPVSFVVEGQRIEVLRGAALSKIQKVPKQLRLRLGIICDTEQATINVPSKRGNRLDVEILSA